MDEKGTQVAPSVQRTEQGKTCMSFADWLKKGYIPNSLDHIAQQSATTAPTPAGSRASYLNPVHTPEVHEQQVCFISHNGTMHAVHAQTTILY